MRNLVEHMRKSATRLFAQADASDIDAYVDSFRSGKPDSGEDIAFRLGYPPSFIVNAVARVLESEGLSVVKQFSSGSVEGTWEGDLSDAAGPIGVSIRRQPNHRLSFTAKVEVNKTSDVVLHTTRRLPAWTEEFAAKVKERLRKIPDERVKRVERIHSEPARVTVLAPGKELTDRFRGTLRDYSGCASEHETKFLLAGERGVLPLGKQAFTREDGTTKYFDMLYLSPLRKDGPLREHQGALICAPQNSGKTELIVRWARAANQRGYNLFLVDVKGNLHPKLRAEKAWKGQLYHLTTDPRDDPRRGGPDASHMVNFLEGLDASTPLGARRIRELAEAILPSDGFDSGENLLYRQNWLNWLTAMIHLVLLDNYYNEYEERRPDLSDVYDLAADEEEMLASIERIEAGEKAGEKPLAEPSLASLFSDIALLLPPIKIMGDEDSPREGQRSEHSYRWFTENIVAALRPFKSNGTLYSKISGEPAGRHFQFESLASGTYASEPVTIVLSARLHDLDDAKTMLAVAITRLQQALFDRMGPLTAERLADEAGHPIPRPLQLRPVLLLLDETRRIRNFKANEYITFAREAEAGCVVVYQSLDQIGEEKQIMELLENVGTQIYLGSLVGNTAKYFVSILPKRYRPTFSLSSAEGDEVSSETLQEGQEQVDYFSTADLYILPAGEYPALVYLNSQPRSKPILVCMDKKVTGI